MGENYLVKDLRHDKASKTADEICKKISSNILKTMEKVDINQDLGITRSAGRLLLIITAALITSVFLTHNLKMLFFGIPLLIGYFIYIRSLVVPILNLMAWCQIGNDGLQKVGFSDAEFMITLRSEINKIPGNSKLRDLLEAEYESDIKYYSNETAKNKALSLIGQKAKLLNYNEDFKLAILLNEDHEKVCVPCDINKAGTDENQIMIFDNGCILSPAA